VAAFSFHREQILENIRAEDRPMTSPDKEHHAIPDDIPDDLKSIGLQTWIDALRDGSPEAGNIIARVILAERNRCADVTYMCALDNLPAIKAWREIITPQPTKTGD
jgi:hypothetical protein